MSKGDIPEDLRRFIFDFIDSVEQVEVLLFLRLHRDQSFSSDNVASQLRSSPLSVKSRLTTLHSIGLLEALPGDLYQYRPTQKEFELTVDQLAESYKVRPHQVLGLIFSPLKKARHFADAFMVSKSPHKKEPEDG